MNYFRLCDVVGLRMHSQGFLEMYSRQTYCCVKNSGRSAVPESSRIAAERCTPFYTHTVSSDCSGARVVQIVVPVVPGGDVPYVDVKTVSASATVQSIKQSLLATQQDPYNPQTRFSQYFPPTPPGCVTPVRIPNNIPLPPETPCIETRPFQGSTKK